MNGLSPELVAIIRNEKRGAWLKKFDESVEIINTSAAQDAWISRGSIKANVGFGQGVGIRTPETSSHTKTGNMVMGYGDQLWPETVENPDHDAEFALQMCLQFGSTPHCGVDHIANRLETMINPDGKLIRGKHSMAFVKAWVALCEEKGIICAALDEARPKPVITDIGLSPRVSATLEEMNLRVDLPTIKMAEIKYNLVPRRIADRKNPNFGQIMMSRDGNASLLDKAYYVAWTPGTRHRVTRFSGLNCNCEACGKSIPSGLFVPIEADDRKIGHIGMWIGCDCARNIFGVKDIGLERK